MRDARAVGDATSSCARSASSARARRLAASRRDRAARRGDGSSLAGEGEQIQTVVYTSCNMILACSRATQLDARDAVDPRRRAVHAGATGRPISTRSAALHHGKVLLWTGDWAAAEAELEDALQLAATEPSLTPRRSGRSPSCAWLRTGSRRPPARRRLADHPATTHVVAALHWPATSRRQRRDPAPPPARARRGAARERALLELLCAVEVGAVAAGRRRDRPRLSAWRRAEVRGGRRARSAHSGT